MKKEYFDVIMENLQQRVDTAKNYLDDIITKDDLLKLPLKQVQETISICKVLQKDMDKIYVDLHHIFGMGNLSVIQSSKLISLMNEFVSYRSDIKAIASIKEINNIPNLPTTSSYTLTVLGDIKLTSSRGQESIVSPVATFSSDVYLKTKMDENFESGFGGWSVDAKYSSGLLSYVIEKDPNETISIIIRDDDSDIAAFGKALYQAYGENTYNINEFVRKVKSGKTIFGVKFRFSNNTWNANISKENSCYTHFNKLTPIDFN